ncbi:putative Geranylgeranyl transferase type-2 subunit beta 2 [Blattamonas nauphoetae]|uniref:Geranylgeranyl transferase type-2 subunit beta n=1 Tax=Blattamonas nauphoetae TaxID=2049346 RepID=A0ABQ9YMB5_9EUKA|nr:putative Geranylgeranyl transferase type-2 subunit beta 2 [Blattamonas nauphoetae]
MFYKEKHINFITSLLDAQGHVTNVLAEHLKMNGLYWALSALDLLDALPQDEQRDFIREFVFSCFNDDGGFGGAKNHDSHILTTCSAVQISAILGFIHELDKDKIVEFIASLQKEDGSFTGDRYGEVDTRFSLCATLVLSLFDSITKINVDKAASFIKECRNWDGAFGQVPGSESHGGQIFCCVGSLIHLNRMDVIEKDKLIWWLCERQTESGGLCGRPEKDPDVCYSWWNLSAIAALNATEAISTEALIRFILKSQDDEKGGIADSPDNVADVYHTNFGIAGLSLMHFPDIHQQINPEFALTERALRTVPYLSHRKSPT